MNALEPSNLISTAWFGGQWVSMAVPSVRLHIRHASSAANTVAAADGVRAEWEMDSGMSTQFSFQKAVLADFLEVGERQGVADTRPETPRVLAGELDARHPLRPWV